MVITEFYTFLGCYSNWGGAIINVLCVLYLDIVFTCPRRVEIFSSCKAFHFHLNAKHGEDLRQLRHVEGGSVRFTSRLWLSIGTAAGSWDSDATTALLLRLPLLLCISHSRLLKSSLMVGIVIAATARERFFGWGSKTC